MNQTKLQNLTLRAKQFSTGSIGYYGFGKIAVDGQICQAGLNVVQVNSKGAAFKAEADKVTTLEGVNLTPTTFKTGSRGYRALGKVVLNGKIYQVGGNVTVVNSKR